MNGESDIDSVLFQGFCHFSYGVLCLCDGHSVSWNNDDVFAVDKDLSDLFDVGLNVFPVLNFFLFGSCICPCSENDVV